MTAQPLGEQLFPRRVPGVAAFMRAESEGVDRAEFVSGCDRNSSSLWSSRGYDTESSPGNALANLVAKSSIVGASNRSSTKI